MVEMVLDMVGFGSIGHHVVAHDGSTHRCCDAISSESCLTAHFAFAFTVGTFAMAVPDKKNKRTNKQRRCSRLYSVTRYRCVISGVRRFLAGLSETVRAMSASRSKTVAKKSTKKSSSTIASTPDQQPSKKRKRVSWTESPNPKAPQKRAKKTVKQAATKRTAKKPDTGPGFIVWQLCEYPSDGFHSSSPGQQEQVGVFATKEEANSAVRHTFYDENPWGWQDKDFERQGVEEKGKNDLLYLFVGSDDSEEWTVWAEALKPASSSDSKKAKSKKKNAKGAPGFLVMKRYDNGEEQVGGVYESEEDANAAAKTQFYEKNSWGVTTDEVKEMDDHTHEMSDGLLFLSVSPPDSEEWRVWVLRLKQGKRAEKKENKSECREEQYWGIDAY